MIRAGDGPEILLVHGGASPYATWRALAPLAARWTLARVHRRGYAPSPEPLDGRQDFDVDALDAERLVVSEALPGRCRSAGGGAPVHGVHAGAQGAARQYARQDRECPVRDE